MTKQHHARLGKYRMPLPASRLARIIIGVALILGGCLSFLPLLGIWMLPLGLMVLSVDLPVARRLRRRIEVWWGKRRAARAAKKAAHRAEAR